MTRKPTSMLDDALGILVVMAGLFVGLVSIVIAMAPFIVLLALAYWLVANA